MKGLPKMVSILHTGCRSVGFTEKNITPKKQKHVSSAQ